MFLHAGSNKNIRKKNIIGIFDMDSSTVSPITKKYLSAIEKSGHMENISLEIPKSFILTQEKDQQKIYISQISPATLVSRTEQPYTAKQEGKGKGKQ